jgi:predicted Zn-dependent peptidase
MSHRRALVVSLLLSSSVAFGQPRTAPAAASISSDPIQARIHTLANGLTVMLSVNRAEPRVQTLIAVRAGSKNDPANNTGLAHYLEHMLFKGTDRLGAKDFPSEKSLLDSIESLYEQYTSTADEHSRGSLYHKIDSLSGAAARYVVANEYDRLLAALGATGTNAWTWFDQTVYTNDVPTNQLDRWMSIESERFRNPMLRLFHTELEAVYEEKNISLDRDDDKQFDLALAGLFRNHPYGTQTTLGTVEHLKNPSLKRIREFYDRYYVPNNMVVIIAGDIDPDATLALVEEHFGGMTPRPIEPLTFAPEEPRSAPLEQSVYGPDPESVLIARRMPGAATREAMLLEIVDQLLNYKDAGLIDLELEKKQRVLEAWSSTMIMNDYSVAMLGGRPLEGQSLEQVRDLLEAQVERLKLGDFDEAQLRSVMLNRRIDRTRAFESNSGRAYAMLDAFVQGISWPEYLERMELPETVTKADIVAFANRWLTDDRVVVYKRIGDDTSVVKIPKPAITPVELDRESTSEFARATLATTAPEVAPVFVDFAREITTVELSPGLQLRHHANSENDLFTLDYVFEMGERNWAELPMAIELLPFLGTSKLSSEALSREFFRLGVDIDVSADEHEVRVSLDGPRDRFDEAVTLLEGLLGDVRPDQKALDALVDRELKSRADAKLDKQTVLWGGLASWLEYGPRNPFNDVLSEKQLRALRASDLVKIIRSLRSYRHDVLYYGPDAPEAVAGLLRVKHVVPPVLKDYPPERPYKRVGMSEDVIYFLDEDMVQAEVIWLRKGSGFDPATWPVVEFFNEYYGGGMGAVIFQEIRESRALAYSTFSAYDLPERLKDPAYATAYLGTQADKIDEAITAMRGLLRTMPRSESAFTSAREALRNQIANDRTIRHDVLESYLDMRRLGLDHDIQRDIWERLDSLTFDDIARFHAAEFGERPFAMAVLGSREKIDMKALAKHGRIVEVTLEQLFGY